jgi:hypothetical protein
VTTKRGRRRKPVEQRLAVRAFTLAPDQIHALQAWAAEAGTSASCIVRRLIDHERQARVSKATF